VKVGINKIVKLSGCPYILSFKNWGHFIFEKLKLLFSKDNLKLKLSND